VQGSDAQLLWGAEDGRQGGVGGGGWGFEMGMGGSSVGAMYAYRSCRILE
jgi:hypothetical protein